MGAFELLLESSGVNRRARDGWWALGLVALGLFAVRGHRGPRELLLAWPFAAYAATIAVLAGEPLVHQFGWYRLAMMPFAYLAAGELLWRALRAPAPAPVALVLVLGGASSSTLWLGGIGRPWMPPPELVLVVLGIVVAAAVAFAAFPRQQQVVTLARLTVGAALALILLGNLVESVSLATIYTSL